MADRRGRRIAGAGAVGVAMVFAAAPLAHAAPDPGTSTAPAQPASGTDAQARLQPVADATTDPVQADFGLQKVRVGVQVKSGAWVPEGTTTAGTELTLTETGPAVDAPLVTTCTTDASTQQSGSTATFCTFPETEARVRAESRVRPLLTTQPTPPGTPADQGYLVLPGDTLTIQQTSVNANLVADPATATAAPCTFQDQDPICNTAAYVFDANGLPPAAVSDHASVVDGRSVTITVGSNDETHGAPATIEDVSDPAHGTVATVAGALRLTYTPDAGFAGTDTFTYTLVTANGRSTATVSVVVTAPDTTSAPAPTTPTPTPTMTTAPLANTGTPDGELAALAAGLLLAGGAATVAGRRGDPAPPPHPV
jgi:hypothetical protein